MSRIGKMSIAVPAGVTVEFNNSVVTVKGAKGTLTREIVGAIDVKSEAGHVHVFALDDTKETNARHGLYRALIAGMVKGVSEGYTKGLEVRGVGWKVAKQGNKLVMNVGFSHPVEFAEPAGIKLNAPRRRKSTSAESTRCLSVRSPRICARSEFPNLITATAFATRAKT